MASPGSSFNSNKRYKSDTIFTKGAITRVKVKNFLTFSCAEFNPGPNLNLIIGPNGTGKSSIVCAICLGLAGKTSILGRAGNIVDYIKHGENKATVEIDLYFDVAKKVTIVREIFRKGSSSWNVNGKISSVQEVEQLTKDMNIQVSNLCQFLPQDRVAEFSKMSPQDLLVNTQKAVGRSDLTEIHEKLKKLRIEHKEFESSSRTSVDQLEREIEKNNQLEVEVRNYQDHQEQLKQIELLKLKLNFTEYTNLKELYGKKKAELASKQQELNEAEAHNQPFMEKLEGASYKVKQLSYNLKVKGPLPRDIDQKLKGFRKNEEDFSEKIAELEQGFKEKVQEEKDKEAKIANLKGQVESIKETLRNSNYNPEVFKDKISALNKQGLEITRKLAEIEGRKEKLNNSANSFQDEIMNIDFEMKQINDVSSKRLQILRLKSKDAYEAALWLRNNRNQFKGVIHEPIFTTISVNDSWNNKFVENRIPTRDLIAFVCEDEEDCNKFMSIVKDNMKLKINAVMAPKEPLSIFKPNAPIEQFRRFGFTSYLKDLFTAPEGVMCFLCRMYNVHNFPIGNKETENCIPEILSSTNFKSFYTESKSYTVKVSKFGARLTSTTTSELRKSELITTTVDWDRLETLKGSKTDITKHIEEIKEELQALANNKMDIAREDEGINNQIKKLKHDKNEAVSLSTLIRHKETNIERLESSSYDLAQEKETTIRHIQAYTTKKIQVIPKLLKMLKENMEFSVERNTLEMDLYQKIKEKENLEKVLEQIKQSYKELEESVIELAAQKTELKAQALLANKKAYGEANLQPDQEIPRELKEKFNKLPKAIEELREMILSLQNRTDLMSPVDKSVIDEYRSRKKNIERMKNEAQNIDKRIEHYQSQIEELHQKWYPEVSNLVDSITTNFSNFFSRLGCAGEVSLKMGENQSDYERYGVSIRVKFRDNEALQELNSQRQSGGERSVSTVLYMMALQQLTCVPFRVVDEINQGMDPVNERKVFEFVVETACQLNASQYFLITPKLLPGLEYSANMVVHILYNGPRLVLEKWSPRIFLKKAKKLFKD